MRRRLFTIIAVGSAAVCLLAGAVWVREFFATDVWASNLYSAGAGTLESTSVVASNGWVVLVRSKMVLPPGAVPQAVHPMNGSWAHDSGAPDAPLNLPAGASPIFWDNPTPATRAATTRSYQVARYGIGGVRLVFVIAVSSLLPGLWLVIRGRGERKPGCCTVCGYDLRASPERCPECGTVRE